MTESARDASAAATAGEEPQLLVFELAGSRGNCVWFELGCARRQASRQTARRNSPAAAARRVRRSNDRAVRAGRRSSSGEVLRVAYVYLLRCADDSLYCGWTTDVERRLAEHRDGNASRYTRSRRPVELAHVLTVADRSTALREEARIKRLPRAAKLALITSARGVD